MRHRLSLLALATSTALSVAPSVADASLFIGLQQDAGPIVTVASNTAGFGAFSGSFGEFDALAVSGFGQPTTLPPLQLQSASTVINNAGAADAGTLTIYVTATNNIGPMATQFTSGFAAVSLTPGWTQALEAIAIQVTGYSH